MRFGRVAKVYRFLERVVFQGQLQEARCACLDFIDSPEKVLMIGEGDGRFLAAFCERFPNAEVVWFDLSERMRAEAKRRIDNRANVDFVIGDALERLPSGPFDMITTHFVLDCLSESEISKLVENISASLSGNGKWVMTDFQNPESASSRFESIRRRVLLGSMYGFFGITCNLKASKLIDSESIIENAGFHLTQSVLFDRGFIASEMFEHRTNG